MGFAEKLNPRSTWFLRRHPVTPIIPAEPIIARKETGLKHRLVEFIKTVFKKES